jgi:hypothetical protein
MNQKPVGQRLQRRLAERRETEEQLGKQTPEGKALWEQIRADLAETRREQGLPVEPNLPDVWHYGSERLLKELDGIRDMILRVPATLETRSALQSAIDRVWRVEQDVRYILGLHREGQRAFAQKSSPSVNTPSVRPAKHSVQRIEAH